MTTSSQLISFVDPTGRPATSAKAEATPYALQGGDYVDPATGLPTTVGSTVVPDSQKLHRNPVLPQHPLGAYTDAQYESQVAELRAQTARQYNDVLRQLGYTDDQGNFVMGSAETAAAQKRSEAQYQENLERQRVTHEMQQAGTLFSGYRGTQEGQRTMPYEQTQAQLGIDLPNQLSQLYEQAGNVVSDFVNQHNKLLADAAGRATQGQIAAPGGGVTPLSDVGAAGPAPQPTVTQPDTPIPGVASIPQPAAPGAVAPALQGIDARMANVGATPVASGPNFLDPNYIAQAAARAAAAAPPDRSLANAAVSPPPAPTPAPAYDPGQIAQAAKAKRQQFFEGA